MGSARSRKPKDGANLILVPTDAPPGDLAQMRAAVLAVGEKYGYDAEHAAQVASLARTLFGALEDLHHLNLGWLPVLEHAALLHDIGYFVNARKHHRHSRTLICRDALLDSYPQTWRRAMALIAGNHRKTPRKAPKGWGHQSRVAVDRLTAILRIADALDYSHDGQTQIHRVEVTATRVRVEVGGVRLAALRRILTKKSAYFSEPFSIPVGFVLTSGPGRGHQIAARGGRR